MKEKLEPGKLKVEKLYLSGYRLFWGNNFITIKDFETEASKFFEYYPYSEMLLPKISFIKRLSRFYIQKKDKLKIFADELKNDEEFEDVKFEKTYSILGLPYVVKYKIKKSNIEIQFDGILFISTLLLQEKETPIELPKLLEYVDENPPENLWGEEIGGTHRQKFINEIAPFPKRYYIAEINYSMHASNETKRFILRMPLLDKRIMRVTYPTGEAEKGQKYDLYIGSYEHIAKVIAQDFESLFYLKKVINENLGNIHRDILDIKNKISDIYYSKLTSLFGWFNPKKWWEPIKAWKNLQAGFQVTTKFVLKSSLYKEALNVYKDLLQRGVAYYSIPFQNNMAQNQTSAPYTVDRKEWELEYDPSYSNFHKVPDILLTRLNFLETLAKKVYDITQRNMYILQMQISISSMILVFYGILITAFLSSGILFLKCIGFLVLLIFLLCLSIFAKKND
ncbi:hypothetical protein M0P98_04740 [bacterium]|nr:hypothetical protein [bacterium]